MNELPESRPYYTRSVFRCLSAAYGMLLLGIAGYVVWAMEAPGIGRLLAAAGLVLLGGNAMYAAMTSRRPWIARIGVLP